MFLIFFLTLKIGYYNYVWHDGEIVEWNKATVHLMTHALHYGTSVIEGIRAYATEDNLYVFRLYDHMKRFINSAKIYSFNLKYSLEDTIKAVIDTLKANNVKESCYIRPIAYVGLHGIDLYVSKESPINFAILVLKVGEYMKSTGLKVCVSSWRRINDPLIPPLAKAGGNYLNSVLATQESKRNGYDEAIMLDLNGYVSEAPGENIFIVRNGRIYTPPVSAGILEGITRDTAITIAKNLGYEVIERNIPKSELYISDEIFLTGTAAEIAPVISVDGTIIGDGKIGPITSKIKEMYHNIVRNKIPKYSFWLTKVY